MRNTAVLFAALLIGFVDDLSASTTVAGGNIINQNWTVAGSPYIVQGDISIPSGATLTISAGTLIQFASTDSQSSGLDIHRIELTVKGNIDIEGTADSPVKFSGQTSANPGVWYGIVVNSTATSAIIKHADIANAYFGIYSNGSSVLNASNVSIHDGTTGMYAAGGPITVDRLSITGCVSHGIYSQSASGTISNALILGNDGDGVFGAPGAGSELQLINTTIYGNGLIGVEAGAATVITIRNSLITNNSYGVACDNAAGCSSVSVNYSDVVDNAMNYLNLGAGVGSISESPNYVHAPDNLALKYPSAGIDAGSPINAPDHDLLGNVRPVNATGTLVAQYDMGAYETADDLFGNGFE